MSVSDEEAYQRAPSSLLKTSRKRVRAGMATQTPAGSQVGSGNAGSMAKPCWRCDKHKTECIMLSGGAQCKNCQAKHYGCSLVLPKEVVGGKGGPSGSQQAKAVVGSQQAKGAAGSQTKGWARKAQKTITLGKSEPPKCCRR